MWIETERSRLLVPPRHPPEPLLRFGIDRRCTACQLAPRALVHRRSPRQQPSDTVQRRGERGCFVWRWLCAFVPKRVMLVPVRKRSNKKGRQTFESEAPSGSFACSYLSAFAQEPALHV